LILSGIRPGASNASSATATFKLYSGATCVDSGAGANLVSTTSGVALVYGGTPAGSTATASMTTTVSILPGNTYYWRVTYSGDAFNNGFTTACGSETASVSFTLVPQ
jgi:hypothetical protein